MWTASTDVLYHNVDMGDMGTKGLCGVSKCRQRWYEYQKSLWCITMYTWMVWVPKYVCCVSQCTNGCHVYQKKLWCHNGLAWHGYQKKLWCHNGHGWHGHQEEFVVYQSVDMGYMNFVMYRNVDMDGMSTKSSLCCITMCRWMACVLIEVTWIMLTRLIDFTPCKHGCDRYLQKYQPHDDFGDPQYWVVIEISIKHDDMVNIYNMTSNGNISTRHDNWIVHVTQCEHTFDRRVKFNKLH